MNLRKVILFPPNCNRLRKNFISVFEGAPGQSRHFQLLLTRENEMSEHITVPYESLFQFVLMFSRHAVEVIFSLGPMIAKAMAQRSSGCVHLNTKLTI